jgi:hypothetical protein
MPWFNCASETEELASQKTLHRQAVFRTSAA